ncbi:MULTISPECIES: porin [unclassified Methylibium]|uniref:porin n=1 Tax=unclassified Methylibium TaxID=2633235 RepID=UPI0003F42C3E|nr:MULTISPECIES: porin [unclassified Methylibium]EWS57112.1 Outer membrane porin protein 32 precursor [Methylibium sp. T29]EWS61786.1 Outer membrane porin protein 32 precursor [Methylibium sp. T29-B]
MKKSVLALAALGAFAGAASAQSSVTLYGRADTNITRTTPGDNRGESIWNMKDGGTSSGIGGSRWGLRGVEDLGGGLKALFVLESGFNLDTGSNTAGDLFNRASFVGLNTASLGEVRFGRQDTLSRQTIGGFVDVTGLGEMKLTEVLNVVAGAAGNRPIFQELTVRVSNAVGYVSPSFGGFQLLGMVGLGEGPASARHQGLSATFKSGPVAAALTYEAYDGFGDTYNKVTTVGGNYNFGVATLFAGYQNTSDYGTQTVAPTGAVGSIKDYDAYTVGVMVPFGNLSIRGQYARASYDIVGGADQDLSKYGISARYSLSKRTTLYSAYTERSGDNDNSLSIKREITLLGVAHTF